MSEENNNNQNNKEYLENYEENENMEEINQGEVEYEEENMNENGDEEEGQEVYAFDIQINEDLYLLIIGKTDENKLLLRLINKEDETKPFFQNEFTFQQLRNLNPFFDQIDDENSAFNYIISNFSEAEKEVKAIDEEKIKISLSINDTMDKVDISFILFKIMNDYEEEEIQNELMRDNNNNIHDQIENEEDIEEGVELMDNLIEGNHGEDQVEIDIKNLNNHEEEEENINKQSMNSKNALSSNLPLQIRDGQNRSLENKEISKKNIGDAETILENKEIPISYSNKNNDLQQQQKEIAIDSNQELKISNKESIRKGEEEKNYNNDEIILVKEELLEQINNLNENFNNQLFKQKEFFLKIQKEMKEENENKIKEIKNELNKKDNDLIEMKNKFENLNKKITNIENNLNENNGIINNQEEKINKINNKIDSINQKLKNIKNIINEEIEKNNQNVKTNINEISKQMGENIKLIKSMKEKQEKIYEPNISPGINDKIGFNIDDIQSQIDEIKNIMQNNAKSNENKMKIFNEKINNLDGQLKENNNILMKIENENIVNEKEDIYNKLNNLENIVNNFNSKFKNIEDSLRNSFNKKVNKNENNEILFNNKLSNFENIINNLEYKVNILENNINNKEKPENNEIIEIYNEKISELENLIKNIDNKINDYEIDQIIQNLSILMEKQNDTEIYDKINNLEIEINEIKKNEMKSNIELKKNAEKKNILELSNRINNIENIIKLFETQFQKNENEKINNKKFKINLDNLEKRISKVSKQVDDLDIKSEQLFSITKNLENATKELNNKTNDIKSNINKMPISKEIYHNDDKLIINKKNVTERNKNNYIYMNNDSGIKYSKENMNNNVIENKNGYQIMIKSKGIRQKPNYEMINQYSNNLNERNANKSFGEFNYSYSLQAKGNHIESKIVKDNQIQFLINRMREMHPKINDVYFNLIYRATEDGDRAEDFHNKCDKIGPNVTLIKTKKGCIFGGFTFKNWEHLSRDIDINKPNLGSASRDSRAFGFSVSNQKIYNNEKPNEFAIWCNRNFGPTFKNNFFQIFDFCLRKGGYCSVRSNSHFGGQYYDYEISGGESRFKVEELEVYEVRFN